MSPHVSVMFTIIYKSFLTNYIGMVFPRAFLFKKALPQIQHWYGFPQYESLYAGQDSSSLQKLPHIDYIKMDFCQYESLYVG